MCYHCSNILLFHDLWTLSHYFEFVEQMYVDGEENTLVLTDLTPDTEYAVRVFSIIGEDSSEPLKGTEKTCELCNSLRPLRCFTPSPIYPRLSTLF